MVGGEGKVGLGVDASEGIFGDISKSLAGVDVSCESAAVRAAGANTQIPTCPNGCKTSKIYRDGLRYNASGPASQRWLCTCCGLRFVDKPLKSELALTMSRQICAEEAKNLHRAPKHKHLGARELTDEEKATVKVFEGYLRKEGYSKHTRYHQILGTLLYLDADLNNPEDVKEKIGSHPIEDGAKVQYVYAYEAFMAMRNSLDKTHLMTWERPAYKQDQEKIPFIPEENELDQLIAATNSRQLSAYLRTLKETFTDPGEALAIEYKDISGVVININHPVKDHRPRRIEVSRELIAILNVLPHKSERVFSSRYQTLLTTYVKVRKRLAAKTKNDRFNYIEFRAFRHWGGTRIAELSNGNVLTVMKMLGHKSVENSMKYINIWKLSFKTETEMEYLCVTTSEELKVALLGNYQFVIEKFGASWFRRPKRIAIAGTPIVARLPSVETLCSKVKPAEVNI